MYSISSTAIGLLRYLAGRRLMEARVSGVPGIGVKGTWLLDNWGGAAAEGELGELCCWKLTANVFNASWALGFGMLCLLGNLIRGAWGRTAWITRATGAAILELTLLPMTTLQVYFRVYEARCSCSQAINYIRLPMDALSQPQKCPARSNTQAILQAITPSCKVGLLSKKGTYKNRSLKDLNPLQKQTRRDQIRLQRGFLFHIKTIKRQRLSMC